ncbi:MAG: hypothetical protein NC341_12685 [Blautia sp.]|nr:hypothetical protein [Blautia sp.]MCM1200307.1 hypothetical protein [Bacteroides fragilis]
MAVTIEDKRIRLQDNVIEYKKGFKWHTLPYEEIRQAYLRVEEVNGRLCCGVASFDMFFLMLKTKEGELLKIEAVSKDIVKRMLAEIKKKNEKTEIGYKKQETSA